MKAADLPREFKQQMLDQMRTQIGPENYDRMVDALGEDGLINLGLDQLSKAQPSPAKKAKAFWETVGAVLLYVVLPLTVWAIFGWKPAQVIFFILVVIIPLLLWLLSVINSALESATKNMRF